ncbi:MAG: MFS transporter [Alkalispirochaetaceae bacterium]
MKGFTRKERSWVFYDWANSAYSIIITTAIFPLFYESIAPERIYVATWGFANSGASIIMAVLAPVLGTIADYRGNKKRFFSFFFALGVASTFALALFEQGEWLPALMVYVASAIGFAGANIFYDSFLTDVTEAKRMDWVSANGFGWGYIGSVIPFVISLLLVIGSDALGFERPTTAVRIAFLITALWWLGFSIPLLRNVTQVYFVPPSATPIRDSFRRLADTFRNIRQYRQVFLFLVAYFFYIDGVDTIIKMATPSQGGIQALSRSFYGKIIPPEKSAEFFGFYNIFGRFAAIMGPLLVGGFTLVTGQERFGILSVLGLFLLGGLVLKMVEEPAADLQ